VKDILRTYMNRITAENGEVFVWHEYEKINGQICNETVDLPTTLYF